MQKAELYKFFEGKSSIEEEKKIRKWIELSKNNEKFFMQERLAYDAMLFSTFEEDKAKRHSRFNISPWAISTVAAVALLLIISILYVSTLKEDEANYNTIIVPAGQRINLVLADDTDVWLNSNTKIEYPTKFSKDNRTVFLDGEAYFAVSENKNKPFIVKTKNGDVRVTGTKFNVEAYAQTGNFVTSLFEGGVDIYRNNQKLTSLNPNEKSSFTDNKIIISKISDPDEYLWRRGLIAFNNKRLEEILSTLEKYFDVKIKVNSNKLPSHTYTGKFKQTDGIDYALRVLQRSIKFSYERDDDTNTIYIN